MLRQPTDPVAEQAARVGRDRQGLAGHRPAIAAVELTCDLDGQEGVAAGRRLQANELLPGQRGPGSVAHQMMEDAQADRTDPQRRRPFTKDTGQRGIRQRGARRRRGPNGEEQPDRDVRRASTSEHQGGFGPPIDPLHVVDGEHDRVFRGGHPERGKNRRPERSWVGHRPGPGGVARVRSIRGIRGGTHRVDQ